MSGKEHANADIFSHLPLPVQPREIPMPQELICILERIELSPVTVKQIKDWTDCDPVLSKVHKFVLEDWPNSTDPEFHPYHSRKLELTIQESGLLWGSQIIVPKPG